MSSQSASFAVSIVPHLCLSPFQRCPDLVTRYRAISQGRLGLAFSLLCWPIFLGSRCRVHRWPWLPTPPQISRHFPGLSEEDHQFLYFLLNLLSQFAGLIRPDGQGFNGGKTVLAGVALPAAGGASLKRATVNNVGFAVTPGTVH
jgi:hypothetical protein